MADRSKSSPVEGSGTEDEILQQEIRTDWITPLCLVGFKPHQRAFHTFPLKPTSGESMEDADRVCGIGFSVYFVASWINYQIWMRYATFCLGDSRLAFGFQRAGFVRSPEVD